MSSAKPELYPSDTVMLSASESSTVGQSLISMKSGTVTVVSVKVTDVVSVLVMLVVALGVVDGLDVIELVREVVAVLDKDDVSDVVSERVAVVVGDDVPVVDSCGVGVMVTLVVAVEVAELLAVVVADVVGTTTMISVCTSELSRFENDCDDLGAIYASTL